jgi:hypothetical protein
MRSFVWLSLLALCGAWGPISHQYFTFYQGTQNPSLGVSDSLMAGSITPDIVKGVVPRLHSADFAAYLLNRSLTQNESSAFSFGFALHIIQDYIGHHASGYLNPAKDHPQEAAVDAFVWKNRPQGFSMKEPSSADVAFLLESSSLYARDLGDPSLALDSKKVHPPPLSFSSSLIFFHHFHSPPKNTCKCTTARNDRALPPPLTPPQLDAAATSFKRLVAADVAAADIDVIYEHQMRVDSRCNATSFADEKANFFATFAVVVEASDMLVLSYPPVVTLRQLMADADVFVDSEFEFYGSSCNFPQSHSVYL